MADKSEPLLDLDSRRKIFRHIERNPGLHLRGLQRTLGMPLGTIEYHLHQMERSDLIVSRDDGRFKAFFAKDGLDRRDKDILYYVRQEMPRQIVIQLLMAPGLSHSELTGTLPVSASTCSFHLKKLIAAEIVSEERVGRSKRFRVEDADRVAAVLVRYRRSFLDDLVDRFAGTWLDLGHGTAAGTEEREVDTGSDAAEVETDLITAPPPAYDETPELDEETPNEPVDAGRERASARGSDGPADPPAQDDDEAGADDPQDADDDDDEASPKPLPPLWPTGGRRPPGGGGAAEGDEGAPERDPATPDASVPARRRSASVLLAAFGRWMADVASGGLAPRSFSV